MPPPTYAVTDGTDAASPKVGQGMTARACVPITSPSKPNALSLAQVGEQPNIPKQLRARKAILCLGATQIVLGTLLVAFNSILIAGSTGPYGILGIEGSGIWGGVISVIAGIFAVLVSGRSTKCRLTACMVLSIVAAVVAAIGLMLNEFWMIIAAYRANERTNWRMEPRSNPAPLAGSAGGMAVSCINFAVSIVCATLMCVNASRPCCCCCNNDKQPKAVVIAVPMENPDEAVSKNNPEGNSNIPPTFPRPYPFSDDYIPSCPYQR